MDGTKRDPRGQGDRGELLAALWFGERGASVFIPVFHNNPHFDLIADWGCDPQRIQVKTSTQQHGDRWSVAVCTRGGNRSWSGLVKYLDPSQYDYLFVLVADGRRWLIPASEVAGRAQIVVGGTKYTEYEIDPGQPLLSEAPSLDLTSLWRGSRAVKGDAL